MFLYINPQVLGAYLQLHKNVIMTWYTQPKRSGAIKELRDRSGLVLSGLVLHLCLDLWFIFHFSGSTGLSVLGSVLCLLLKWEVFFLTILPVK